MQHLHNVSLLSLFLDPCAKNEVSLGNRRDEKRPTPIRAAMPAILLSISDDDDDAAVAKTTIGQEKFKISFRRRCRVVVVTVVN